MDDCRQVVGAKVLLDEAPSGQADVLRTQRMGMQVVEHEDVQPSVELPAIVDDIRLDGPGCGPPRRDAVDREVDERELGERLRAAVLEDLHLRLPQVADERPMVVGDDRVDFHVVDVDLERDAGLRRGARIASLLRGARRVQQQGCHCHGHGPHACRQSGTPPARRRSRGVGVRYTNRRSSGRTSRTISDGCNAVKSARPTPFEPRSARGMRVTWRVESGRGMG
jgi:hypothetical protein